MAETESFPRQEARTRRFTLGVPRAFTLSPDGARLVFLRTRNGTDPVTCLWTLDVSAGAERLVADPRELGTDEENLPAEERARRERVRERAGGIVAYACDEAVRTAVFSLSGRVYAIGLTDPDAKPYEVMTHTPALDPRPDPSGSLLAYVCDGVLRVTGLSGRSGDRVLADPDGAPDVTYGLAEFIAGEEMGRQRGYWWAPDGSALLAARVDVSPVQRWHIADPANPAATPVPVAYPAAGTPNAVVTLHIIKLNGRRLDVALDIQGFPYLTTACWQRGHDPLVVVQSRDQRVTRLLSVDPRTGATELIREDTDPHWTDITPGVPAWTSGGQIVWTEDSEDTHRLLLGTPDALRDGKAKPATPAGLQLRAVSDVDGGSVLFLASAQEPAETDAYLYHPDEGVTRLSPGSGDFTGRRAGGTTVISGRSLAHDGVRVDVRRGDSVVCVTSLAEKPTIATPAPVLMSAGERGIRTAVLFPSWHKPGSGKLPVLMDPYGGPHGQRVVAARSAYLESQWFAEQGFAVVVADGRGTPGRGPGWEREVAGDLATPALEDQIAALRSAAAKFGDLDVDRVGIRGWSFGGFLSALAVLRRPDVFHAAIAGAPVTDWTLYDTHYTERYLGLPSERPEAYAGSSLTAPDKDVTRRPLLMIHGLADDNVVVAHTLRLSGALLAAGYPHQVLPLTAITHMAADPVVAENLLGLQLDFLRRSLG